MLDFFCIKKNVKHIILSEAEMKVTSIIAFILVIVGAIVWGLIGIFNFNLVALIFGAGSTAIVSRIIYTLVGLSGLWLILFTSAYNPFKNASRQN